MDLDALKSIATDETVITVASIVSAVIFVGSLVALPIVIVRLPTDYFAKREDDARRTPGHLALAIVRNVVGVVLLLVGLAMLVLPGQGVLMILASLVVMQFPGKKRLERKLVARKSVLRTLNRIRKAAGKPPLDCRARGVRGVDGARTAGRPATT